MFHNFQKNEKPEGKRTKTQKTKKQNTTIKENPRRQKTNDQHKYKITKLRNF